MLSFSYFHIFFLLVLPLLPRAEEGEGDNGEEADSGIPDDSHLDDNKHGVDAQQPPNAIWEQLDGRAVPEAACDKPGAELMTVDTLCSQPPHKGTGSDDVFRYYYNPIVQQCIPFSYSGRGGNANRFVSVKNCYEICHPAQPTVKKPRVVSAIKAYLVPNLKRDCPKPEARGSQPPPREVVIRQIPHPLDSSKTLTIIQNTRYIPRPQNFQFGGDQKVQQMFAQRPYG